MIILDCLLIGAVAWLLAMTAWAWREAEKYEAQERQDPPKTQPPQTLDTPLTVEQILERASRRERNGNYVPKE